MTHSPEPWTIEQSQGRCAAGPLIKDAKGFEVVFPLCDECRGEIPVIEDYDAERIVACVNACAGIPTDVLNHIAQHGWQKCSGSAREFSPVDCPNEGQSPHTCPFGEQVHGDSRLCTCCIQCETQCRYDV